MLGGTFCLMKNVIHSTKFDEVHQELLDDENYLEIRQYVALVNMTASGVDVL